jgi:hypothetical protein
MMRNCHAEIGTERKDRGQICDAVTTAGKRETSRERKMFFFLSELQPE